MKILTQVGFFTSLLVSATFVTAQTSPEWVRVYTFGDSIIELNTRDAGLMGEGRGRVTFRQTFTKPQTVRGTPGVRFASSLEVYEFDCKQRMYRPFGTMHLNAAGEVVHFNLGDAAINWRPVTEFHTTQVYSVRACELIGLRENPLPPIQDLRLQMKAARVAFDFWMRLEKTGDVGPLVRPYFAPNYFGELVRHRPADRFAKLDPETAAKLTPAELRRYYVALLNAVYLGSRYLLSLDESDPNTRPGADELLVSPAIIRSVDRHPYSIKYRSAGGDYSYLVQDIGNVGQARLYTDLLERANAALRLQLTNKRTKLYLGSNLDNLNWDRHHDDFGPVVSTCKNECYGLPAGTTIYTVDIPIFDLQMAVINGQMKIVSIAYPAERYYK